MRWCEFCLERLVALSPVTLASFRTLLIGTLVSVCAISAPSVAAAQTFDLDGEGDMFNRINTLRNAAGLPMFRRHASLDAAARTHSADMAWHSELEHVSERTGDPAARVSTTGLDVRGVGENIARNADTLSAHQALVASEPHLANLLSPDYTHIGVASMVAEGEVWVTQVFATLADEPAPAVAPAPAVDVPSAVEPPVVAPAAPAIPSSPAAASVATPWGGGSVHVDGNRLQVQVGSAGAPMAAGPRPRGYWVFSGGRWWYYPVPPGAQAGQQLQPDPSVTGPPPGHHPSGYQPGYQVGYPTYSQPVPPPRTIYRVAPSAPPLGWSPRRHYQNWRYAR
jgi:uncharacterized protein YkwD